MDSDSYSPQEVQHLLGQLICLNGMMTDPDCPGVEKVVATSMKTKWRTSHQVDLNDLNIPDNSVLPESVFMVKGWNRAVSCLAVLMAAYELPTLYQAGCHLSPQKKTKAPCCRRCQPR